MSTSIRTTVAPASTPREAGVWIDHRRAIIAILSDTTEQVLQIASNLETHSRDSGAARDGSAEDQRDRRSTVRRSRYYDEVVACLRNADAILILGPGEAKGELEGRLGRAGLRGRVVGIETEDKMTDRQVVARVRRRFSRSKRRLGAR